MASGTHSHGKLLDYEQYIDQQIAQARSRIKVTDILTSVVVLVAGILGVLLVEVVLDHLIGLPLLVRQLVLILGVGAAVAYAVVRIVQPLVRRVNELYAARTIEQTDPAFKNSLLSYLELRRHREELPARALAAVESRAVQDLTRVEIDTVVDQGRLVAMVYVLCGVVVLFCLYAWLTPKSILDSARRALLADVVRPTNTRLVNLKPGDDPELATVVAGAHVPVSVEVQGTRPESVVLHFSTDGGRFFAERQMQPGERSYDPWTIELTSVQQSLDYYIKGGDARSKTYHLRVLPAPMVTDVEHDKEFPRYTGFAPVQALPTGNIEALEGTLVTLRARTNQPAAGGEIALVGGGSFPMTPAPEDATRLTGQFRVKESGRYTIQFRTTGGQLNPDPVVYDITAHPDAMPVARFVQPGPSIQVPANARVRLLIEASDDFGLKDVTLHVRQGKEILRPAVNFLEQGPPTRTFNHTEILDLSALRVRPGTKFEYWLAVRDTKEPQSNRVETNRQIIEVIDPLSEQELAEREQQEQAEAPPEEPSADTQQDQPADAQDAQRRPADAQEGQDQPADAQEGQDQPADGQEGQGETQRSMQPGDGDPSSDQAQPGQGGESGQPRPGGEGTEGAESQGSRPRDLSPEDLETLRRLEEAAERLGNRRPSEPGDAPPEPSAPPEGQSPEQDRPSQGQQQPPERTVPQDQSAQPQTGQPGAGEPQPAQDQAREQARPSAEGQAGQPEGQAGQPKDQAGAQQRRDGQGPSGEPQDGPPQGQARDSQRPASGQQPGAPEQQPGDRRDAPQPGQQQPGQTGEGPPQGRDDQGADAQAKTKEDASRDRQDQGQPGQPRSDQAKDQDAQGRGESQGQAGTPRDAQRKTQDTPQPGASQDGQDEAGKTQQGRDAAGQPRPGATPEGASRGGDPGATESPQDQAGAEEKAGQPGVDEAAKGQDAPSMDGQQPGATTENQPAGDQPEASAGAPEDGQASPAGEGQDPTGPGQPAAPKGQQDGQADREGQPGAAQTDQAPGQPQPGQGQAEQRTGPEDAQKGAGRPSGEPEAAAGGEDRAAGQPEGAASTERSPSDATKGAEGVGEPAQDQPDAGQDQMGQPSDDTRPTQGEPSGSRPPGAEETRAQGGARPGDQPPDGAETRTTSPDAGDATKGQQADSDTTPPGQSAQDRAGQPQQPAGAPDQAGQPEEPAGQPQNQAGQQGDPSRQMQGRGEQSGEQGGPNQDQTRQPGDQSGRPDAQGEQSGARDEQPGGQAGQTDQPGPPAEDRQGMPSGTGQRDETGAGESTRGADDPMGEPADPQAGQAAEGQPDASQATPTDQPQPGEPGGEPQEGQPGGQPQEGQPQEGQPQEGQPGTQAQPGQQPGAPQPGQQPGEPGQPGEQPGEPGQPGDSSGMPSPEDSQRPGAPGGAPTGEGGRPEGPAQPPEGADAEPQAAQATTPERAPTRGISEDVAPETPQPDLVLNQIKDILRDQARAEELAEDTGMSVDELNQFVRRFEGAPDRAPGEARTLEVEPGESGPPTAPRTLDGPLPSSTVSGRSERGPNTVPQDAAGGNTQGVRTVVPPEYSSRFEAYRQSLSGPRAAPSSGGGR